MLYKLLYQLSDQFVVFNVFQYITFRVALAAFSSFMLTLFFGPIIIRKLKQRRIGAIIHEHSDHVYEKHKYKEGTPNMGGILILGAVVASVVCWADMSNPYILIVLGSSLWLGFVGFVDDYLKNAKKSSRGLSAAKKFVAQAFLAVVLCACIYFFSGNIRQSLTLYFPFFKNLVFYLGFFYAVLIFLVIVGSSNAVNLTDGLDGLAIGCVIITVAAYAVMSYIAGHYNFSNYLNIPHVKGAGELAVFCASIMGAGLGFLWFNCYPAEIFMGDTGSLFLGGAIGIVALIVKQELLLIVIGGVFVIEALSVILQVISFKLTKKRIFLVAPIHHHFEAKGWPESRVITRFWIVALVCAVLGLAALKLR